MPMPRISAHRALLIVDAEPQFVTPATRKVIPAIVRLLKRTRYPLYVVAEYTDRSPGRRARKKTQWERTYGRLHHAEETVPEIAAELAGRKVLKIAKSTRSLFGSDDKLAQQLRRRGVREVHIVGLETHDCILATALDAFDHEFKTRVLLSACASKHVQHHRAAGVILRNARLNA